MYVAPKQKKMEEFRRICNLHVQGSNSNFKIKNRLSVRWRRWVHIHSMLYSMTQRHNNPWFSANRKWSTSSRDSYGVLCEGPQDDRHRAWLTRTFNAIHTQRHNRSGEDRGIWSSLLWGMCVIRIVRQFFCSSFVLKGLKVILNISYLFSIREFLFLCTTCCRVRELGFAIVTPHPIWHLSACSSVYYWVPITYMYNHM